MNYDKFIWKEGDIEFIDEKVFVEEGIVYDAIFKRKFDTCIDNKECLLCDDSDMKIAEAIIDKIYVAYFQDKKVDRAFYEKVLNNISLLSRKLLKDPSMLTQQLHCCIRMGLMDKVKKNGNIVAESGANKSLWSKNG